MGEKPFNYDYERKDRTLRIAAAAVTTIGGVALSFVAERYRVARYEDSRDILQIFGAAVAIPAAAILINTIDS